MSGTVEPELVQRTLYECPKCGKRFSTTEIYGSHYRSMCAEPTVSDAQSLVGEYVLLRDNGECGRVTSADVNYVNVRVVHRIRGGGYRALSVFDTYLHINKLDRIPVNEAELIVYGMCSEIADSTMDAMEPKGRGRGSR